MNARDAKKNDAKSCSDIVIREMITEDERLVKEFFETMGGESRALFNRGDYNRRRTLKYCANQNPQSRYWIATLDEKMAGYVFFTDWNTTIPELGIAVREDLWGKHLGSRLMDHAIEEAKKAGKGGIRLTTQMANLRGQVLYEKKGFKLMGQYKNAVELFYLLWFEV